MVIMSQLCTLFTEDSVSEQGQSFTSRTAPPPPSAAQWGRAFAAVSEPQGTRHASETAGVPETFYLFKIVGSHQSRHSITHDTAGPRGAPLACPVSV